MLIPHPPAFRLPRVTTPASIAAHFLNYAMPKTSVLDLKTVKSNVKGLVEGTLAETGGLLRLAPAWVPRSFLQPGLRIKLHPDDTYAYGLNRGGIDERWFASTTVTANEGRAADEGLNYCVVGNRRFTLQQAVAE